MEQHPIEITEDLYRFVVSVVDERMAEIRVTREDFDRLTRVVGELTQAQRDLAQAQLRTERRLESLEAAIERLAEAQARTEERVDRLEAAIERLAQAQARTEERVGRLEAAVERLEAAVERLDTAVERLAQAQARTEERVGRLEAAVERLEAAVERLAQAQMRTEIAVQQLTLQMGELQRHVGALANTIGFGIEDVARVMLPPYLERHHGIRLEGAPGEELQRRFFEVAGREMPVEINLYGEGRRNGQAAVVLGEAKSRIGGAEVARFIEDLALVEPLVVGEIWRVMFGFYIHPSATPRAQEHHILLVASYQR